MFKCFKKNKASKIPDNIQILIENRHQNTIVKLNKDLIVDDNKINILVLEKYLNKIPRDSDACQNGLEVLEILSEYDYDIIWIDIKMPIMDGYETTQYLRNPYPIGFGYTGKIVGVTGFADEDSIKMANEAGMSSVITKPYVYDNIRKNFIDI